MTIEHKNIAEANLHEVKGASTATSGQILKADGAGSTSFVTPFTISELGLYNYDDSTTSGSPIALTTPGTFYDLTNDGAGPANILTHKLSDVDNLWNTSTNRFDWSGLALGDSIEIRIDVEFTTSTANTAVKVNLELATGSGSEIDIPLVTLTNFKSAGTYRQTRYQGVGMLSSLVQSNPARIKASSDTSGCTVVVNGWYIKASKKRTIV